MLGVNLETSHGQVMKLLPETVNQALGAKSPNENTYLIIGAVQAAGELFFQVNLGGGLLQEVRQPLHQKVSVLQVGKEEGHAILGTDGERAGQHAGAVRLLHDGHLQDVREKI